MCDQENYLRQFWGANMILPGLVSVTFRNHSVEEIIEMANEAGLQGIEWGGDIHVPQGNVKRALEVGNLTRQAGLKVAAYGSYYRVGCQSAGIELFENILETAVSLGAPTIRVWAGNKDSENADSDWRALVVEESRTIADMAFKKGITICFEYHSNTLTDTAASAMELLQRCDHDNIRTLWQPSISIDHVERQKSLEIVSPWLSNLHVYHWQDGEKYPLQSGEKEWLNYLKTASLISGDRYALLEFVMDNSVKQFKDDARTLRKILASINSA